MRRFLAALGMTLLALAAHAEQYKSEVRDLPGTPPPAQLQDPQQLLQATTDPYERALLLRELATKAAAGKDYDAAAKYLEQAIGQDALSPPAVAEMRKGLVQLLVASGQPAEVVKALEPQVRDNPNATPEQQAALGGAYLQLGRHAEAVPLLQRAVARSPAPDESWLQALFAAHAGAGQSRAAIPVLEKLVRRNPGQRDYWLALASLLHQAGDEPRALAVLELANRQGHLRAPEERLQLAALTARVGAPFEAGSLLHAWLENGQVPRTAQNHEALERYWLAARESLLAVDALQAARQPGAVSVRPGAEIIDTRPELRGIAARLTEVGAERDANADGTIPSFSGGITQPPPGYGKDSRLVDPFPQDRPRFTITAANAAQHAARLSPGHRALLAKYPGFSLPVYETRRSAAFPPAIYQATAANLGKARLLGSDALSDARLGFPFPQPQNGVEVMWNHRTRYRGDSFTGVTSQAVVARNGVSNRNQGVSRVLFRYGNAAKPADLDDENIVCYGVTFVGERVTDTRADFVVLFHESANSMRKARAIWVLLGSVGRMLRLPPLGYDQPLYGSDGIYFIDMIDMYNGAFDRYVWKLVGKRELYVPYNAYRLNDGSQPYAQQLAYPTFSPQNARYELHRVWVIEATERGGKTHAFGKRVFYVDEDSWNVVLVENQDRAGRLWRFQEGHLVTSYDVGSTNAYPIVTYDLKDDRYFVHRLLSEEPPLQFNVPMREQEFLPAAVQARYSR